MLDVLPECLDHAHLARGSCKSQVTSIIGVIIIIIIVVVTGYSIVNVVNFIVSIHMGFFLHGYVGLVVIIIVITARFVLVTLLLFVCQWTW